MEAGHSARFPLFPRQVNPFQFFESGNGSFNSFKLGIISLYRFDAFQFCIDLAQFGPEREDGSCQLIDRSANPYEATNRAA
jgi:hypothetical protein